MSGARKKGRSIWQTLWSAGSIKQTPAAPVEATCSYCGIDRKRSPGVKEFGPLIVSIDTHGNNLFEQNKVIFNQRKEIVADEICKHVSFIK